MNLTVTYVIGKYKLHASMLYRSHAYSESLRQEPDLITRTAKYFPPVCCICYHSLSVTLSTFPHFYQIKYCKDLLFPLKYLYMVYDNFLLTIPSVCRYVTCNSSLQKHFSYPGSNKQHLLLQYNPCILSNQCKCERRIKLRIKVNTSIKRIFRQYFARREGT